MQYPFKNTFPFDIKIKVSVAGEFEIGKKVSTSRNKLIFSKISFTLWFSIAEKKYLNKRIL